SVPLDTAQYNIPNVYIPNSGTGTYNVQNNISSNPTDGDPSNNSLAYSFDVTDSTYARDNGTLTFFRTIPSGEKYGQLFEINAPTTASSVSAYIFDNGSTVISIGSAMSIEIYDLSDLANPVLIGQSPLHVITANNSNGLVSFSLGANGISLNPGDYYVTLSAASGDLHPVLDDADNVFGTVVSNTTNGWFAATGTTPIIQLHLAASCATSAQVNTTPDNGGNNGTATAIVSGGSGSFGYSWSNGASGSNSITGLASGSYSVTITDLVNPSCSPIIETFQVPFSCNFIANWTVSQHETTPGANDGIIVVNFTSGTPTYNWNVTLNGNPLPPFTSSNANSETLPNLAPGVYCGTVTDANGCSVTGCATINAAGGGCGGFGANVSTTPDNGTGNGTATATPIAGTAPYTYTWSNGGTSSTVGNLAAGSYNVTVIDANNCTTVVSGTVGSCSITLQVSTTDETFTNLNDGTASATASGVSPYTYIWTTGATTSSISNLAPGTYGVTVTDAIGCSITDDSVVINPAAGPNCSGFSVNISGFDESAPGASDGVAIANPVGGTAPYDYNWSNGATVQNNGNLSPGQYFVTVIDVDSCVATGSVTISTTGCDLISSIQSTNETAVNANDGTATVSVSNGVAPYTYNWSNGDTSSTASGLAPGTYTVTIYDTDSCWTIDTAYINPFLCNMTLSLTGTDVSAVGATDGTANASVLGGSAPFTYSWSTGATTTGITGLPVGTYSVTVVDNNGCRDSSFIVINNPGCNLSVSFSVTHPSNFGVANGSAIVTVTGGTTPYTYSWNTGQNSDTATGLVGGHYFVTIMDANGCSEIGDVYLIDPPVGINTSAVTQELSIFPNPFHNSVTFKSNSELEDIYIWDLQGKLLFSKENLNTKDFILETGNWKTGSYIIKVISNNNVSFHKLIKAH
ncbi:MAG: T9SS type A sorting domain-containing protein, partial [Flavobacteriales bacterium]|nr:T9SS type A sorting domain-containing protein [Flavobacteriales bacterium]